MPEYHINVQDTCVLLSLILCCLCMEYCCVDPIPMHQFWGMLQMKEFQQLYGIILLHTAGIPAAWRGMVWDEEADIEADASCSQVALWSQLCASWGDSV